MSTYLQDMQGKRLIHCRRHGTVHQDRNMLKKFNLLCERNPGCTGRNSEKYSEP